MLVAARPFLDVVLPKSNAGLSADQPVNRELASRMGLLVPRLPQFCQCLAQGLNLEHRIKPETFATRLDDLPFDRGGEYMHDPFGEDP